MGKHYMINSWTHFQAERGGRLYWYARHDDDSGLPIYVGKELPVAVCSPGQRLSKQSQRSRV